MRELVVYRKKAFAYSLVPFWIVTYMKKDAFIEKFQLDQSEKRLKETGSRYAFSPNQIAKMIQSMQLWLVKQDFGNRVVHT